MTIIFGDDKDSAPQDILSRIRFYAYPYAVHASRVDRYGIIFEVWGQYLVEPTCMYVFLPT